MKLKLIALILLGSFYGKSQDSLRTKDSLAARKYERVIKHEIGVNATYFLKQLLSPSSSAINPQPYQLTYKLIVKNKWAARVGLGVDMNSDKTTINGSTTPRETTNSSFFGRLGVEYRKSLGKRFVGYAGIDFVTQLINSKTTSSTDNTQGSNFSQTVVSSNRNNAFGGGPVLGIQFYVTRRISFYTEMPITFMLGKTKEVVSTTTINNNGGFGQPSVSYQSNITNGTNTNFGISIPMTIYFAVKF